MDSVATATLGTGKSGSGLQAVEYWKEGKIQELADYCIQDVRVTKEIYDFAGEHGFVKFEDRMGQVHEIPIDVTPDVQATTSINLAMAL